MDTHLESTGDADVAIIHLIDTYPDTVDPDELDDELMRVVQRLRGTNVVIDLKDVQLLESLHLGMLIRLREQLETEGRRLQLAQAEPHVCGVFVATRLDHLFPMYPTVAAAIAAGRGVNGVGAA